MEPYGCRDSGGGNGGSSGKSVATACIPAWDWAPFAEDLGSLVLCTVAALALLVACSTTPSFASTVGALSSSPLVRVRRRGSCDGLWLLAKALALWLVGVGCCGVQWRVHSRGVRFAVAWLVSLHFAVAFSHRAPRSRSLPIPPSLPRSLCLAGHICADLCACLRGRVTVACVRRVRTWAIACAPL
jgi:hypothetical protein